MWIPHIGAVNAAAETGSPWVSAAQPDGAAHRMAHQEPGLGQAEQLGEGASTPRCRSDSRAKHST